MYDNFRRIRKISPCLSGRPSSWNDLALTGLIFMKFVFWGFSKICRDSLVLIKNLTVIAGTLHEELCTFMIVLVPC
jgi:hypothetical protein